MPAIEISSKKRSGRQCCAIRCEADDRRCWLRGKDANMNTAEKWVTTTDALIAAIQDESIAKVVISGRVVDVPTIRLSPGRSLCGAAEGAIIAFAPGAEALSFHLTTVSTISICLPRRGGAQSLMMPLARLWVGSNCTALALPGTCKFLRAARCAAVMSM